MSRIEEIWEMARYKGVVAVKVVYPDGGHKSYLTEAGKKPPTANATLYGDKEEEVFNLFRYPELNSKVVGEYFKKLEDERLRQAYWDDPYAIREELRQQFKEQLYKEAEAILTVPQPVEPEKKPITVETPDGKEGKKKQEEVKPIYRSRTVIGNLLAVLIVMLASQAGLKLSEEQAAEIVALIFALMNLFFRAISDKPVR